MKRRSFLVAVAAGTTHWPFVALSQGRRRMPRVGIVFNSYPQAGLDRSLASYPNSAAIEEGLRQLGWVNGKNIELIARSAESDYRRFPQILEALVRLPVDVLVIFGPEAATAAKAVTKTLPIVWAGSYVLSATARPSSNVTGVTYLGSTGALKRLELLKMIAPKTSVVAMFARVGAGGFAPELTDAHREDARRLGLQIFASYFDKPDELDALFVEARRRGANGVLLSVFPLLTWSAQVQSLVVNLAMRHRMPTVFPLPNLASQGGLISHGVDDADGAGRIPYYIDRILRGAKPSDLPIEQIAKVYLNINRTTARALGLEIPQALALQADNIFD